MERNGWIMVENHKNQFETPATPWMDNSGKTESISGFGELFRTRKDAQDLVTEMEGNTWPSPLEVRRAKLVWWSNK